MPNPCNAPSRTVFIGDNIERRLPALFHLTNGAKLAGGESVAGYLTFMSVRLLELHRVLKPGGSVYLHCGDTAVHYLKGVMDAIFGIANYRNNIVWRRATSHNAPKRFGRVLDHLLYYAKGGAPPAWNADAVADSKDEDELRKAYPSTDKRGRYRGDNMTGPRRPAIRQGAAVRIPARALSRLRVRAAPARPDHRPHNAPLEGRSGHHRQSAAAVPHVQRHQGQPRHGISEKPVASEGDNGGRQAARDGFGGVWANGVRRAIRIYAFAGMSGEKAGIQMAEAKFAARNQVQMAVIGSLPPLWGKARMGVSRASGPRPGRKPTHASPLWGKAGMGAPRASAALQAGDLTFCKFLG